MSTRQEKTLNVNKTRQDNTKCQQDKKREVGDKFNQN